MFFFFKQKTAYELRISDWSSDVCSADRPRHGIRQRDGRRRSGRLPGSCPSSCCWRSPSLRASAVPRLTRSVTLLRCPGRSRELTGAISFDTLYRLFRKGDGVRDGLGSDADEVRRERQPGALRLDAQVVEAAFDGGGVLQGVAELHFDGICAMRHFVLLW